ncbi:hypothetical protein G6M89_14325 [Natronolimnobius sp. AArcel1]|uniref:hypothetical protein n=1 Tax=Natronolimnobius sp. AArcel1 TaxID=1679093 RepID=UPI0013ECC87F|nr:hypothetical protein [Natronolimnobius sp. AArcel1]
MSLDSDRLETRLNEAFGGSTGEARVVSRQATDLAESGQYETDTGIQLTADIVLEELTDAPGGTPADRWNWWIGALEIAYGGYRVFGIRQYRR